MKKYFLAAYFIRLLTKPIGLIVGVGAIIFAFQTAIRLIKYMLTLPQTYFMIGAVLFVWFLLKVEGEDGQ